MIHVTRPRATPGPTVGGGLLGPRVGAVTATRGADSAASGGRCAVVPACGGTPAGRYTWRMLPAKDIFDAALLLPPDERARLVRELSATLEGLPLSDEWEDEIARRVSDLEQGRVNAIPAEQLFSELERRFGGK